MIVHLTTTLKIDPAAWAAEYGVEPDGVEHDVRTYLNQDDIVTGLNERNAFGPNVEVVAATISHII